MSRVEEVEKSILNLDPQEFARIVQRIREIEQSRWDDQLDSDARSGKLDFLREEAREAADTGTLRDWPPSTFVSSKEPTTSSQFASA